MKFKRAKLIKAAFWNALLGSALITRAATGAVYAPPGTDQVWQNYRAGKSADLDYAGDVPAAILARLEEVATEDDLWDLIRISYLGASADRHRALDRFWIVTLSARPETHLIEDLLSFRSDASTRDGLGGDDLQRFRIWQAAAPIVPYS